jgi:hypothetical protein
MQGSIPYQDSMSTSIKNFLNVTFNKIRTSFLQKLFRKKTFYLYKFFSGIPLSHNGSQQNDNKYRNKLFSLLSNEGVLTLRNRERHAGSILFPDSMSTSIKIFLNVTFDKIRNSFFAKTL